jgi:hypothetical protein
MFTTIDPTVAFPLHLVYVLHVDLYVLLRQ